tara:strand:- start:3283 stop:4473 length:1191 start_codon:yes stop_codon:yes gene_type:complete
MWQNILKRGLVNTKKIIEQFNGNYGQRVVAQELKRYTDEDRLEVAGEKLVDIDVKMTKLQGREIGLEGDFELESGKKGTFEYTSEYSKTVSYPNKKRRFPVEAAKEQDGMPNFPRGRTEIELDGETTNKGTGSLNVFLTDIINAVMQSYSEDYGDGPMAAVPRTDDDDGSSLDFGQGMDRRNYDPYGYGRGLREDFGSRKNKVSSWKDVLGAGSVASEETRTAMKVFRELKEAMKGYNKRMDDDLELALTKEEIEEYFPSIDLERLEGEDMYSVLGPFRMVKFGNVSEISFTFDEVPNAKEGGFTTANGAKFGVYASLNNRVMDNPSIGQSRVEGPSFGDFKRETNATPQEIMASTEDIRNFLRLTEPVLRGYLKRSQEGKFDEMEKMMDEMYWYR